MCLDCGCFEPENSHGDPAHITMAALKAAADADGIAPEKAAANILTTVTLTAAGQRAAGTGSAAKTLDTAACRVLKASDELQFTFGLAYPSLRPDRARAADGFIDAVRPEVLEKTAWDWLANQRKIGLFHKDGFDGHGTVVESTIWRAPDWEIVSPVDGSSVVVKAGDWLVGVRWDDYGWRLVKEGIINGWSPEGGARRRAASPEFLARLR